MLVHLHAPIRLTKSLPCHNIGTPVQICQTFLCCTTGNHSSNWPYTPAPLFQSYKQPYAYFDRATRQSTQKISNWKNQLWMWNARYLEIIWKVICPTLFHLREQEDKFNSWSSHAQCDSLRCAVTGFVAGVQKWPRTMGVGRGFFQIFSKKGFLSFVREQINSTTFASPWKKFGKIP